MLIRCIWKDCDHLGASMVDDAFWLEATREEAEKYIFPLLSPRDIDKSIRHAREGYDMATKLGNPVRPFCFLVFKNGQDIFPFHVSYPFHQLWNGYSPFEEMTPVVVKTLDEIKSITV